jgi:hypothetical protein
MKRILLVVACVALLMAATGCIEVRDRPESGDFSLRVVSPPVHLYLGPTAALEGAEAELDTELGGDVHYSWDIGSDGSIDFTTREAQIQDAAAGLESATYIVSFHEESRNMTLLLAFTPEDTPAAATVADLTYTGEAVALDAHDATPLEVTPTANLTILTEGPLGTVLNTSLYLPVELGLNVSLPVGHNGSLYYVAAFHPWSDYFPADTVQSVSLAIEPGEAHTVTMDAAGDVHLVIRDASGAVVFAGLASDVPGERHVAFTTIDWEGSIGEEEAPGMGAPFALAAVAVVAMALGAWRRMADRPRRTTP